MTDADRFLDDWQNFKLPALRRMLMGAMIWLAASEDHRAGLLWADDLERHDRWTADNLGGLADHLADELSHAQRKADDLGISPAEVDLDLSEIREHYAQMGARARARMAPRRTDMVALARSILMPDAAP